MVRWDDGATGPRGACPTGSGVDRGCGCAAGDPGAAEPGRGAGGREPGAAGGAGPGQGRERAAEGGVWAAEDPAWAGGREHRLLVGAGAATGAQDLAEAGEAGPGADRPDRAADGRSGDAAVGRGVQRVRDGGGAGPGAADRHGRVRAGGVVLAIGATELSGAAAGRVRRDIRPAPAHAGGDAGVRRGDERAQDPGPGAERRDRDLGWDDVEPADRGAGGLRDGSARGAQGRLGSTPYQHLDDTST